MSEQPTNPDAGKKDTKESFALPKNQQLSATQHIFIWALIIVVGVLFGMGSTIPFLGSDAVRYVGSVSENEILTRQSVTRRLQDIINPMRMRGGANFEVRDPYGRRDAYQMWAERIKLARYAESQGLMPGGKALEEIEKKFLNETLPDNPQKRYADLLDEALTTDKAVKQLELRRYLAEERARELLGVANVVAPAVPTTMADAVNALPAMSQMDYYMGKRGDQVTVDEVILTAKHLLPEVKEDDPEIQQVYDRLKGERFNRPTAVEVTVAYADVAALAAATVVPDTDIEAYYNAHKEDYRKQVEPPKPEPVKEGEAPKPPAPPPVEYKPLAEVSAEIKEKLAKERAELKAKEMVKAFDTAVDEAGEVVLEAKDNASFKALAAKQGLQVRENLRIDEASGGGNLNAGDFGMLSESQLHLFNQDIGMVTSAVQSTGDKAAWLVLRIDARHPAGYKDLSDPEVKKAVITVIQGERAYKDFLAKAEEIRAAAEQVGPGGLKKWAESDAAKVWKVSVASNTFNALTSITPPPNEPGGLAGGEPKLLAAMAMPERPVALGTSPAQDDVPAMRLVQVTAYKPAPAPTQEQIIRYTGTYRSMLENYRYGIFSQKLTAELRDQ